MSSIEIVTDRGTLIEHFNHNVALHAYGLADLEQRFWVASQWWHRNGAFVGRVPLPGPEGVIAIYAIDELVPEETSRLVLDLYDEFPPGALIVGPTGCDDLVGSTHDIERLGAHVKMVVTPETFTKPERTTRAEVLREADLDALLAMYATDPGAAFFLPSMLDDGLFAGVWDGPNLIAGGGTHVRNDEFGVAALGAIFTAPTARGTGLGADVTALLTERLLDEGRTVVLNTHADNHVAHRLYGRLGYKPIHTYTEFIVQ